MALVFVRTGHAASSTAVRERAVAGVTPSRNAAEPMDSNCAARSASGHLSRSWCPRGAASGQDYRLELGHGPHMTRPFGIEELLARIFATLGTTRSPGGTPRRKRRRSALVLATSNDTASIRSHNLNNPWPVLFVLTFFYGVDRLMSSLRNVYLHRGGHMCSVVSRVGVSAHVAAKGVLDATRQKK